MHELLAQSLRVNPLDKNIIYKPLHNQKLNIENTYFNNYCVQYFVFWWKTGDNVIMTQNWTSHSFHFMTCLVHKFQILDQLCVFQGILTVIIKKKKSKMSREKIQKYVNVIIYLEVWCILYFFFNKLRIAIWGLTGRTD